MNEKIKVTSARTESNVRTEMNEKIKVTSADGNVMRKFTI